MFAEQRLDVDELILRCRDKQAKAYIAEAVACYKVGAYRSSIVATWIAVVFDILHKLRELELTGDANARAKLEDFERIRGDEDLHGALRFEREILGIAKDEFELLSLLEYQDLNRIFEDRHRCAHPSMNVVGEVYNPPAETARYHLRNAVMHLLQHPPVQGKAALDRLISEVDSPYFPTEIEDAVVHFEHGPLGHPREALVRNFVDVLTKSLLLGELNQQDTDQHVVALAAVREMHRPVVEQRLAEKLNNIVDRVKDDGLSRVIVFLYRVNDTWQHLEDDTRGRLQRFVRAMPSDDFVTLYENLIELGSLEEATAHRLENISIEELQELIWNSNKQDGLVRHALDFYDASSGFSEAAERRNKLVIPLVEYFDDEDVKRVIELAASRSIIRDEYAYDKLLYNLLAKEKLSPKQLSDLLRELGLDEKFTHFLVEAHEKE